MRNTLLYCLTSIVITITLFSCKHQETPKLLPELEQAELIMYEHPDSALIILEQMQVPPPSDDLQYATWCLLITQAKYKNYLKQPTDSLINIAYKYFMQQDNPHRKAMVLYYEGALNMESNKVEKATEYYLKAAKEAEDAKDYKLMYLIHNDLGQIYLYRSLEEYALIHYERSCHYAKMTGDKIYISSSLSSIARIYARKGNWEECIKFYTEAIDIAKAANDQRTFCIALSELSGIYRRKKDKDYVLALKYAKEALEVKKKENFETEQTLLIIGDIYRLTQQSDSAYYYLDKATLSDNIYTKSAAYQALYYLSQEENDCIKTMEYCDKYLLYTDSIQLLNRSSTLIEMQEKYNQEKTLNDKNQLEIERDQTIRAALLALIVALSAITTILYTYHRKLIEKKRTIEKNEEQIYLYTLKIHENEILINENENHLKILSSEIEQNQEIQEQLEEQQSAILDIQNQNKTLRNENQVLQKNIWHYASSLQEKTKELNTLNYLFEENQRLHDREEFLCDQLIKKTDILNKLKNTPCKFLDVRQWHMIYDEMNKLYDNYTERLSKEFPALTESDMQICCLIKLHMGIPEIADLLGISSTSVSKRKQRLKEHIIQGIGKPWEKNETIDSWLWKH